MSDWAESLKRLGYDDLWFNIYNHSHSVTMYYHTTKEAAIRLAKHHPRPIYRIHVRLK